MRRLIVLLAFCMCFLSLRQKVMANEVLFFDSTDHYLGACQLTNKSEWRLDNEIKVTKFQVWYNWNQGEVELPVKLYKDGELFADFVATRSSCDPYQNKWCNADFDINKVFPPGKYSTVMSESRQCLKPGGTGTIRLYMNEDGNEEVIKETPLPTIEPTFIPTAKVTQAVVGQTENQGGFCNCNKTEIVTSAAITSGVVSFLLWAILRRV